MKPQRFEEVFAKIVELAVQLRDVANGDALLILLEGPTEWHLLKQVTGDIKVLVASDTSEALEGCEAHGLFPVVLDTPEATTPEKLTQAMLEGVAQEVIQPGAGVVAIYS